MANAPGLDLAEVYRVKESCSAVDQTKNIILLQRKYVLARCEPRTGTLNE